MWHAWQYTDLLQSLKGEPLSYVLSSDGTLISASTAPHCGGWRREWLDSRREWLGPGNLRLLKNLRFDSLSCSTLGSVSTSLQGLSLFFHCNPSVTSSFFPQESSSPFRRKLKVHLFSNLIALCLSYGNETAPIWATSMAFPYKLTVIIIVIITRLYTDRLRRRRHRSEANPLLTTNTESRLNRKVLVLVFSAVGSRHKRSFITGFLEVLSWAQYSLLCIHSHCLTSFLKESAIITNLLTTLPFTNHQLCLTFIHWFTTSSSMLILLGVGWLATDWSLTMIKLKLLWLDLAEGSVCYKTAIWELAVMIFLSKAMSKASGFTLMLPCLWQSILITLVVQHILRSEELALFAIS